MDACNLAALMRVLYSAVTPVDCKEPVDGSFVAGGAVSLGLCEGASWFASSLGVSGLGEVFIWLSQASSMPSVSASIPVLGMVGQLSIEFVVLSPS